MLIQPLLYGYHHVLNLSVYTLVKRPSFVYWAGMAFEILFKNFAVCMLPQLVSFGRALTKYLQEIRWALLLQYVQL